MAMSTGARPMFLEIELIPAHGDSPADRLTVLPPVRALLPLFPSPVAFIVQNPTTGKAQVTLAGGTVVETIEKWPDFRRRMIQHAEVIQKDSPIES